MKNKTSIWLNTNKPGILLGVSIVSLVGSLAMTVLSTVKAKKEIDSTKMRLEKIIADEKEINEDEQDEATRKFFSKLRKKEYAKMASKTLMYYAPSILLAAISIGTSVGSYKIMSNRLLSMTSAYSLLKTSYDLYRTETQKTIGEDKEKALYSKFLEEYKKTKTTSKTEKSESLEITADAEMLSVLWGPENVGIYDRLNPSLNLSTLLHIESWFNETLRARGYVFLDEVYDALGFGSAISPLHEHQLLAARSYGWIYDMHDTTRQNFISFGLHDSEGRLKEQSINLKNGAAEAVWLTFNVDGNIYAGASCKKSFTKKVLERK